MPVQASSYVKENKQWCPLRRRLPSRQHISNDAGTVFFVLCDILFRPKVHRWHADQPTESRPTAFILGILILYQAGSIPSHLPEYWPLMRRIGSAYPCRLSSIHAQNPMPKIRNFVSPGTKAESVRTHSESGRATHSFFLSMQLRKPPAQLPEADCTSR